MARLLQEMLLRMRERMFTIMLSSMNVLWTESGPATRDLGLMSSVAAWAKCVVVAEEGGRGMVMPRERVGEGRFWKRWRLDAR